LKFYIKNLLESNAGGKVIKYLTDRGLDLATIRTFKLGYSQDKWTSFVEILNQKNVPLRLAEKVGIIIKKIEFEKFFDLYLKIRFIICNFIHNLQFFHIKLIESSF